MPIRKILPVIIAVLAIRQPALAQNNMQNWENNEVNQINQDTAAGLVNSKQASRLLTQDAQIQLQTQRMISANGGYLTPSQQALVGSEMRQLKNSVNKDMYKNNPNLSNAGYPGWAGGPQNIPVNPGMASSQLVPVINQRTGQPIINPATGLPYMQPAYSQQHHYHYHAYGQNMPSWGHQF